MNIYKIAKKQASSLPGYELINMFEAAFPVYRLNIVASAIAEQQIPVVEEYILRLVSSGVTNIDNIKGILGLSDTIVKDYIVNLLRQELVSHELKTDAIELDITPNGLQALERLILSKPVEITLPLVFDASTSLLSYYKPSLGLIKSNYIKGVNIEIVRPYLPKPQVEEIDLSAVRSLFKSMRKNNPELVTVNGEILDLLAIDKVWVEYKKMNMLVFYSQEEQDIMVRVFERTERVMDYEKVIMRMERDGLYVLPTNRKDEISESELPSKIKLDVQDLKRRTDNIEKVKEKIKILTKRIPLESIHEQELDVTEESALRITEQELSEANNKLEELCNENRILSTYEHRPILERALSEAKERIILISPWITGAAMDSDLISKIDKALQRKVSVHIGYGIGQECDEKEIFALEKLKKLQKKHYGALLKIYRLGNTHEKVLVCDERFAVITSFNWMSFKGSPDRGFRKETGFLFFTKEQIKELITDIDSRFENITSAS